MATSCDPASFVGEFLKRVGPKLGHFPAPFDYTAIEADNAKAKLPAGLLGKLSQLRETEEEITARFAWERGSLTQTCISRRTYNSTVYDSEKRTIDLREEKERSSARERWYCDLAVSEKTAFDQHCLAIAGSAAAPLIPATLPFCLHGALARLALEAAELTKSYSAKRSQIEKSLRDRGLANPTVMPGFLQRVDADEKEAISRLVGRWLRELTSEQEATLDSGTIYAKPVKKPAEAIGSESGPRPPSDGTICDNRIILNGKPNKLTPGLRELLAFLLAQNGATLAETRNYCGYTDNSHLHKRLNDLRNRLTRELKGSEKTLSISTVEGRIFCEWKDRPALTKK